jgi:ankyrin repeat protein
MPLQQVALIVRLLLDDATALMQCGLYGSALKTAIYERHIDIVRMLLKECDVDIHGEEGDAFTPLWLAVQAESRELVHILLDAGANVNNTTVDEGERTPLHLAASQNNTGLADSIYFAELFLCHGAVTHLLDNRELILLQTAAKSILSHEEYAETLLHVIVAGERKGVEWGRILISVDGNLSREDCEILLVTAGVRGNESEVKNLMNFGASTTTLELLRTLVRVAENRAQEALPDGEEHKRKFQSIAVLL